ncbi:hypothetical protein, partial [Campylobacter troglodytis]|uniref:hypothetical protein n=1 Tax=Campylobacter troglodytis TaxID=654363 RepID=UPI00115B2620
MKFTELSLDEYKKLRLELLQSVEGFKEKIYKDKNSYATIGIGINIASDKIDKIWLKLVLYYLFDLLKDEIEIELMQFDSYKYSFKKIIKDTTSYKYKQYKRLIDKIADSTKGLNTANLNKSIETEIQSYLKESTKDNKRLNEAELKITKNAKGEAEYIKFTLSQTQAQELFNIMIINYEALTLRLLNNKGFTEFGNLKELQNKQAQRRYYKEFIPFVSASYQDGGFIAQNKLLAQALKFQSRFLMWALLRYDFVLNGHKEANKWDAYARRRILQATIFNLTNKKDKELETESEKFSTCLDIFKVLNLLDASEDKQTYLEYFEGIDGKIDKYISKEKEAYKNKNIKNKTANYKDDPSYSIYRSLYINPNELKSLKELLSFYTEYLDELVP